MYGLFCLLGITKNAALTCVNSKRKDGGFLSVFNAFNCCAIFMFAELEFLLVIKRIPV